MPSLLKHLYSADDMCLLSCWVMDFAQRGSGFGEVADFDWRYVREMFKTLKNIKDSNHGGRKNLVSVILVSVNSRQIAIKVLYTSVSWFQFDSQLKEETFAISKNRVEICD